MVTEIELFEYTELTTSDFCLRSWVKSEVDKRKVDTRDELLARILDAAARFKKCEDQLRRNTRDLCTQVTKWIEVEPGFSNICELQQICHLRVINLLFKHYIKINWH
jgi:hypothetical protein